MSDLNYIFSQTEEGVDLGSENSPIIESETPFYRIKKVTNLADLSSGKQKELPISDLAFQNEKQMFQFELVKPKKQPRVVEITPGVFSLEMTPLGINIVDTTFNPQNLLKNHDVTTAIRSHFDRFFNNLSIYDELGIDVKKRSILLYGPPGTGKTASINDACLDIIKDKKTAIIIWGSSNVRSGEVLNFLTKKVKYSSDVERLIMIIEDIGMGVEGYGGPKEIDKSLLAVLDGTEHTFLVPTFIIATTNYAHNLPEPLIRPGRFDDWVEVPNPSAEAREALFKFFLNESLTELDLLEIKKPHNDHLSVAAIKEIAIRTKLYKQTLNKTLLDMSEHRKKFNNGFENKKKGGLL